MVRLLVSHPIASYYAERNIGLILVLPVYNVWKLQMRTPQKAVVIGLFLLGGFTTITGIIRLHFLAYAYASLKHPLYNDVTCKWLSRVSFSILSRMMRRQFRTCILLVDY